MGNESTGQFNIVSLLKSEGRRSVLQKSDPVNALLYMF